MQGRSQSGGGSLPMSAGATGTGGGASSGGEELGVYDGGKRKAEMTAEERTNYERERNRMHARNTRARKKQYMEELKDRVENMHAERAAAERRKEDASKEEQEQIGQWESTLRRALNLRCEGVTDEATWTQVLSENFLFSLPVTPYRAFDPADVEQGGRRVLYGVQGMIADTLSLTELCVNMAKQCLRVYGGGGRGGSSGGDVEPRVHLGCLTGSGELLFSASDGIMCMFNVCTVDARAFGSPLEVDVCGMLRASFSDEGKLEELDMMFDGVAAYQQLQRAMGCDPCDLTNARVT